MYDGKIHKLAFAPKCKFVVRDRETGTEIEETETLEDAKRIIRCFEEMDAYEGLYEPDFYEVAKWNDGDYETVYD